MEGKFLVYDLLTEKPVGSYSSRDEANKTLDNLLERDLERLLRYLENEGPEVAYRYHANLDMFHFENKLLEKQLQEIRNGEKKANIWLGANSIMRYMMFDLRNGYDYKGFLRDFKPWIPLRVKTIWLSYEAMDLLALQKD